MVLDRSPEFGIGAFTECWLPMIDEVFLPLDIQTATAVIEQLSLAWEAMWGRDEADF